MVNLQKLAISSMEDGLLYAFSDDREVEMHVGEHFALGLFDKNLLVGYVVVHPDYVGLGLGKG